MKRNMTISRKIAVGALSVVVGCSAATVNPLCASTRVCRDRGEV